MCKLAEYTATANSSRRRSIIRAQVKQALKDDENRHWWHNEAKHEVRKWLRTPGGGRSHLLQASNRLRDQAAEEAKKSKQDNLRASARAIEAFLPISAEVRDSTVVWSAGRRERAHLIRCGVRIIVAPDLLLLEPGSELVVGAVKLHASQEHKLNSEALLNAATMLFTYLGEHGDAPKREKCTVVDLFEPAFQSTPRGIVKRMRAVEDACEEIENSWQPMVARFREELAARKRERPT